MKWARIALGERKELMFEPAPKLLRIRNPVCAFHEISILRSPRLPGRAGACQKLVACSSCALPYMAGPHHATSSRP